MRACVFMILQKDAFKWSIKWVTARERKDEKIVCRITGRDGTTSTHTSNFIRSEKRVTISFFLLVCVLILVTPIFSVFKFITVCVYVLRSTYRRTVVHHHREMSLILLWKKWKTNLIQTQSNPNNFMLVFWLGVGCLPISPLVVHALKLWNTHF